MKNNKGIKFYVMARRINWDSQACAPVEEIIDWLNSQNAWFALGEGRFTLACATGYYVPMHLNDDAVAVQMLLTFPDLIWKEKPRDIFPGG